jgi:hypothetical protein
MYFPSTPHRIRMSVECEHVPSERQGLDIVTQNSKTAFHLPHDILMVICNHLKNMEIVSKKRSHARVVCKQFMLAFMDTDILRDTREITARWFIQSHMLFVDPQCDGFGDILRIVNIIPSVVAQLPSIACYAGKETARGTFTMLEVLSGHFREKAEHVDILREILWNLWGQKKVVHPEHRDPNTGDVSFRMGCVNSGLEVRMTLRKSKSATSDATDMLVSFVEPKKAAVLKSNPISPLECINHMLLMSEELYSGAAADIASCLHDFLCKWESETSSDDKALGASGRCSVFITNITKGSMLDLSGAICVAVSTLLGVPPYGRVRLLAFGHDKDGILITGVSCDGGEVGTGFVSCSLSLTDHWLTININFAEVVPTGAEPVNMTR